MRTSPRYAAAIGGLTLLSSGVFLAPAAHAQGLSTIRLIAAPSTIKADGRSTTIITAEVRDESGGVVPEGTQVRFAVTAGRLQSTIASTQNGVARVILTSGDLPGESLVTANLEGAGRSTPAQITVIFSNDADAAEVGPQWVRINGKQYTGYAADKGVIQANGKNGGASIGFRNLDITADALQYDVTSGQVTANENVTLNVGDTEKKYTNLRINLMNGQGVAERVDADGHSTPLWIDAVPVLVEKAPENGSRDPINYEGFQLKDISDSSVAVTARSIAVQPGRVMQFRSATFYLDGVKTASLPFHIMPLDQKELFAEQVVGVNSQGVTVDFPLYLNVNPSGVNTLHIRRGARVGSSVVSNKPGWSFDMEQNYNLKRGEGTAEILGISRSDWGARFRHAERFAGGIDSNFYVDVPNHRDLFGQAQLSRRFGSITLNASGSGTYSPARNDLAGNRIRAGATMRGQLYASTDPRPFLGQRKIGYTLNLGTTRQDYYGLQSENQGLVNTYDATLRLTSQPLPLTKRSSISQSLTMGQTWVAAERDNQFGVPRTGATLLGTTAFNYRMSNNGSLGLTYDYTQTPLLNGGSTDAIGRHRVGLTLYSEPLRNVNLSIGGSRGLDVPNDNLSAELNVSLGGPWRTRTRYFSSQYVGSSFKTRFSEMEYGLFYRLGGRDLAMYYSTTLKRIQFDVVGARF